MDSKCLAALATVARHTQNCIDSDIIRRCRAYHEEFNMNANEIVALSMTILKIRESVNARCPVSRITGLTPGVAMYLRRRGIGIIASYSLWFDAYAIDAVGLTYLHNRMPDVLSITHLPIETTCRPIVKLPYGDINEMSPVWMTFIGNISSVIS